MTVYKAIRPEANVAAELAYALCHGEKPGRVHASMAGSTTARSMCPSILLTPISVTRDNIMKTVVADQFWSIEQICTADFKTFCDAAGAEVALFNNLNEAVIDRLMTPDTSLRPCCHARHQQTLWRSAGPDRRQLSKCGRAKWWGWSAITARASRRWSSASPESFRSMRASIIFEGTAADHSRSARCGPAGHRDGLSRPGVVR